MHKEKRSSLDFKVRSELKRLGRRVEFSCIKEGEVYHIPPLLELRRKTILVEKNLGQYIKCVVEEDGKPAAYNEWIYDYELQAYFITPYKRNFSKKINTENANDKDDLPF